MAFVLLIDPGRLYFQTRRKEMEETKSVAGASANIHE